MVLGTGIAIATVATGGAAAAAGAAIGTAAGTSGAAVGSAGAVSAALATSGGAIAGSAVAGTATGTAAGAIAGGSAAVGTWTSGAGLSALVAGGPVGWIALGAAEDGNQLTFDCWKPVVHDTSREPSNGVLIKDIVCHPNIASVTIEARDNGSLPHIVLENVWREQFELQYFVIQDSGRLVAHASNIDRAHGHADDSDGVSLNGQRIQHQADSDPLNF